MVNTRRSFLFGRRTPPTPWGQFCARLSRSCAGQVSWRQDGQAQAMLTPAREQDYLHARALCSEFGVKMALWVEPIPHAFPDPVLWVEPGRAWARAIPAEPTQQAWRVDAGYSMGQLQALGFSLAQDIDPSWSVAQWLASPLSSRWPVACGSQSGILRAEILMHDGSRETLGPFGASAVEPLRSITMQLMVPGLFQLLQHPFIEGLKVGQGNACGYRLDAMLESPYQEINLARLLAGHGASLAWLLAVWLHRGAGKSVSNTPISDMRRDAARQHEKAALDEQVKHLFDPHGIFMPVPLSKG